jgi:hypothetical protein
VRDSYVHSAQSANPGGGGYGIGFNNYAADNLVENNIVRNFNKLMVMRTSGGGNVIAYNYLEDGWGERYPTAPEQGLNAAHMTTAHMELFEGNQSYNFDSDSTWGNAAYITVFRNHLTGLRRGAGFLNDGVTRLLDYVCNDCASCPLHYEDIQGRRVVGLTSGHLYYTFLGNVLGYEGMGFPAKRTGSCIGAPSSFTYESLGQAPDGVAPMWELGRDEKAQDKLVPDVVTPIVEATIREGNYDFVSREQKWNEGPDTLPASLYLTSKPAFFGDLPWPWVDAGGPTKTHTLPARARFDVIHAAAPGRF